MSAENKFVISLILIIGVLFSLYVWWEKSRTGADRLDCQTEKCFDKKNKEIPLSECTDIGLTC